MQFLYQNVLFLMLIPLLLLIFLISTNKDSMQKVFSQEVLSKLSISNKYLTKTSRNVIFFIALILMTIALSRPVINEKEQAFKQEITPIVVAIDISKSMLASDLKPTRAAMAKNKLLDIIKLSEHNGIGVVLFAKSAFILSPITQDFKSLKYLVNNLDSGQNFDNGSNIYATLEASNKLLKNYENKNVLILSDGGNKKEYTKEIEYAKENNLRVYTIALASEKPTPIKTKDGYLTDNKDNIVTVKLNEAIKALSLKTKAGYIEYSLDNSDLKAILNDIETQSKKDELKSQKYKTYTELFYYPLALAIVLILFAFSSMPSRKVVASLLCLFIYNDTQASILDFKTIESANKEYSNKEYSKASTSFQKVSRTPQGHYNFANSLYKEKKYKSALDEYKKVITSNKSLEFQKLHNMGNTYAQLQDLSNAKKMYEKALTFKKDKETKENLETINKLLKKEKKKDKGEGKNKNKKEQSKKQEDKKSKDSKKENQDKDKKKKKEDSKKNKDNKKQENSSNKNNKNKTDKQDSSARDKQKESLAQEQMSELEEKKWLKKIKSKKTPVLLRKVESKSEDNSSTPW